VIKGNIFCVQGEVFYVDLNEASSCKLHASRREKNLRRINLRGMMYIKEMVFRDGLKLATLWLA
jgi:hypothetical protein